MRVHALFAAALGAALVVGLAAGILGHRALSGPEDPGGPAPHASASLLGTLPFEGTMGPVLALPTGGTVGQALEAEAEAPEGTQRLFALVLWDAEEAPTLRVRLLGPEGEFASATGPPPLVLEHHEALAGQRVRLQVLPDEPILLEATIEGSLSFHWR